MIDLFANFGVEIDYTKVLQIACKKFKFSNYFIQYVIKKGADVNFYESEESLLYNYIKVSMRSLSFETIEVFIAAGIKP